MRNITLLFLATVLTACQTNTADQQELTTLRAELDKAKAEIAKQKLAEDPPLVHVVYLNLKKDLTTENINDLISAIQKLKEIPQVKGLEYGHFKNLEDPRALSDYEMVFQMHFANEQDYAIYQTHPAHLALKESTKNYLAAPPATYDYLIQK